MVSDGLTIFSYFKLKILQVNDTNYTSATSQENHVDSTATHVTLNRGT